MGNSERAWTVPEVNQARQWLDAGYPIAWVAKQFGRTAHAVESKLYKYMQHHGCSHAQFRVGLATRLDELSVRKEGLDRRDLTGRICGDPPIGFSALDKRGGRG